MDQSEKWMLTGAVRHRKTWLGRLILQVEEQIITGFGSPDNVQMHIRRWRDARERDLDLVNILASARSLHPYKL